MNQVSLPVEINPEEIGRKHSLGAAIELCADLAGFGLDKELQSRLGVDKAQFSRWQSGTEGVVWPKLVKLMDECGNDAPLLWMLHQRGYDLHTLRKTRSEVQRQLDEAQETIKALRRVMLSGGAA
jgi:plasmid maintenance system antidote protein VapI